MIATYVWFQVTSEHPSKTLRLVQKMATSVVECNAVNSVFSRHTDDECTQYDSSEDSDEDSQVSNNASDAFVISFTDTSTSAVSATAIDSDDSVSDSDSVVKSSTSKPNGLSLQEAFKRYKKKKQVGEVCFDVFFQLTTCIVTILRGLVIMN